MVNPELGSVTDVRNELIKLRDQSFTASNLSAALALTHAIAHLHRLLPVEERDPKFADIPTSNEIISYFHCSECLQEMFELVKTQGSARPELYARYSVGLTPIGIQVVCSVHKRNITHIDFEGQEHPGNYCA